MGGAGAIEVQAQEAETCVNPWSAVGGTGDKCSLGDPHQGAVGNDQKSILQGAACQVSVRMLGWASQGAMVDF
jgi:hypothetical protein